MGSVGIGNNALLGAFQNATFSTGLDLGRCQIREALGVYVANPTASFQAGMLVGRDSAGLVVVAAGATEILGVAKWAKTTSLLGVKADEAIVLTGAVASNLSRANVSNVAVKSAAGYGGTTYTLTTDYTVNTTNGTITRAGAGITSGATVFVNYTFAITSQEVNQQQGTNFWNNLDDVSQADNRITVITDAEIIFTAQYDSSRTYSLTGVNSNLYASVALPGLFTNDTSSSAKYVGRVFQLPSASDPYMGVRLVKGAILGA